MQVDLLKASDRQHLMLLYDDEKKRNTAEIDCINKALADGQLCIYATTDLNDKAFAKRLSRMIHNYDKHLQEGNLVLVNFLPFYEGAAKADLALFKDLKRRVETLLYERVAAGKRGKVLAVADAACNLTRHRQFDACVSLESWWQETYLEWMDMKLDITIICAHPMSVLENDLHNRSSISKVHSLTLDLQEFEQKTIRMLVAEPESDLQMIYKRYFHSLPVDIDVVRSGKDCLEKMQSNGFDTIILDSHLADVDSIEIARKILQEKPDQHIVITSTSDTLTVRKQLNSGSIQVISKPFKFSDLLSIIRPAKLN